MNWGTCGNTECAGASNNIHFDFPPLMSDGRNFTNWNPAVVINEQMRRQYGIESNNDYRQFLMANADKIIERNRHEACDQCGACEKQWKKTPRTDKHEYLYNTCHEKKAPYGYEESDLKASYLSREQLQAQMNAPIMSQSEYLSYFRR